MKFKNYYGDEIDLICKMSEKPGHCCEKYQDIGFNHWPCQTHNCKNQPNFCTEHHPFYGEKVLEIPNLHDLFGYYKTFDPICQSCGNRYFEEYYYKDHKLPFRCFCINCSKTADNMLCYECDKKRNEIRTK